MGVMSDIGYVLLFEMTIIGINLFLFIISIILWQVKSLSAKQANKGASAICISPPLREKSSIIPGKLEDQRLWPVICPGLLMSCAFNENRINGQLLD